MIRWPSTGQVACGSALAFGWHAGCFRSLDYAVDDAWIPARVARTFLETGLPTFDATRPLTESFSSPLWFGLHVAILSVFPDQDPVPWLRGLGVLFGILSVAWACSMAARAFPRGRGGRVAALVTGGLLVAHSGLAVHAGNGLESAAWWFTVLVGVDAWVQRRGRRVAVVAGVLILLRPEGLLLGPLLAMGHAWRNGSWRVLPWPLFVLAGLLACRLWVYGEGLPNPAYAKAPDLWLGGMYVRDALMWTGGLICLATAWRAPGWAAVATFAALWVGLSGGDWMPGHRRLGEAQFLLAIGAGIACVRGREARFAAALWLGLIGWEAVSRQAVARYYHDALADIGQRAERTVGITRIAAFDVGRLGWTFEGSIHDFAGLTDRRIGQAPGAHGQKEFDSTLFEAQQPEMVILTTTNNPTLETPSFIRAEQAVYDFLAAHEDYQFAGRRRVGTPDQILLFVRSNIDLPADVWSDWVDR